MLCPSCAAATRVVETRSADGGLAVRRRRRCSGCGGRFTTFERREREPLFVRKRDGQRQRFDRIKLRAALLRAAHKRPVSAGDVEELVAAVEIAAERAGGELSAQRVADLSLAALRELDWGAYLQFAGTLSSPNPQIGALREAVGGGGSVRGASEDSESTPIAASRRGFDE